MNVSELMEKLNEAPKDYTVRFAQSWQYPNNADVTFVEVIDDQKVVQLCNLEDWK